MKLNLQNTTTRMAERFKVKHKMKILTREKEKPGGSVGKFSTAQAAKGFSRKFHAVMQTV